MRKNAKFQGVRGVVGFALVLGAVFPAFAQPSPADAPVTPAPTFCTEQYAPVCGVIGKDSKTYSNACFAKAAGAKVTADGECKAAPVGK